ncbi:MAG: ABC transporter permease subunit [Clostridium sp.]|nr:ABC transporter permease subunit [Clostridium sp.]
MAFIIKKELIRYLKNPLYYIGAVLVFLLAYLQCQTYLTVRYFQPDASIADLSGAELVDVGIMDGYLPAVPDGSLGAGLERLRRELVNEMGMDEEEVARLIRTVESRAMDQAQAIAYLESELPFMAEVTSFFYPPEGLKKGTPEELNAYIRAALERENYAAYFGRKYIDYLGVGLFPYMLVLFAFLAVYDYRKDMYELLHTKPVPAWKYILGKGLGGSLAVFLALAAMTAVFDVLLAAAAKKASFPVNLLEIWSYAGVFAVPVVLYAAMSYLFCCGLFRTPLPAIPALFLQYFYSNMMQGRDQTGVLRYVQSPLYILMRFPEEFFETEPLRMMHYRCQGLLLLLAAAFAVLTAALWKRRSL